MLGTLIKDVRGAVLPLVAIALLPIIGISALAIDISRYYDLQSQLQKGADACALAAAAELDGRTDAQTRAIRAIGDVANSVVWANENVNCNDQGFPPKFYATLPASDADDMSTVAEAATQASSRYVSVIARPKSITTFFPTGLGTTSTLTTSAFAVAGFSQSICGAAPIAMCNGTGSNDFRNIANMRGKQIVSQFKSNQLDASTLPDFTYIDVSDCGKSANCAIDSLANSVVGCKKINSTLKYIPGVNNTAFNYFDTRLDVYASSANNVNKLKNDYSPDVNVRKGFTGNNACNTSFDGATGAQPYPNDSNITDLTSSQFGNGGGSWKAAFDNATTGYNKINFNNALPGSAAYASRYALYNYEISNNKLNVVSAGPKGETGAPACAAGKGIQNRRIMYAIIQDCSTALPQPTAPLVVAKLFVLRPSLGQAGATTITTEVIDVAIGNSGPNTIIHDEPQLVR